MDFGYPQFTETQILKVRRAASCCGAAHGASARCRPRTAPTACSPRVSNLEQEYITQTGRKLEVAPRPPMTVTNVVSWRSPVRAWLSGAGRRFPRARPLMLHPIRPFAFAFPHRTLSTGRTRCSSTLSSLSTSSSRRRARSFTATLSARCRCASTSQVCFYQGAAQAGAGARWPCRAVCDPIRASCSAGMPELRLGLNDKIAFESSGRRTSAYGVLLFASELAAHLSCPSSPYVLLIATPCSCAYFCPCAYPCSPRQGQERRARGCQVPPVRPPGAVRKRPHHQLHPAGRRV